MKIKLTEKSIAAIELPDGVAQVVAWDDETPGFGVVVGRRVRTFVVESRVDRAKVRQKIGVAGQVRAEDNRPWTVQLARQRARELLGKMASGINPHAAKRSLADGPTLREALTYHLGKMERGENRRGKVCSPRSIATLRISVEKHLAEWLDEPLVSLTADAIEAVMDQIERDTPRRADANPKNPPGRAEANRVLSNVSRIWRSYHRRHGLPIACPTDRLESRALAARETRVGNDELPAWHAKVIAMDNHVRRDLQLVAMFTGVRSDGVRNLRWDDVAWDDDLLHIARAKGDRPYAVPLTATLREILERRLDDNVALMDPFGGDHGFVFPSLARNGKTVQAVAEVKERRAKRDAEGRPLRDAEGEYVRESYLPGVHVSRRTRNSIAVEIGCPVEIRERLLNHEGRGVNAKHYSVPHDWSIAAEWAERIDAAIWQRIRGETKPRRRAKLRAV